jgi:hypothetical protein
MGLVAEMPPAVERPQMSAGAPEMDFVAEADRIRRSQKHFMKVPGSLPPVGKMKHEKEAAISQVRKRMSANWGCFKPRSNCSDLICHLVARNRFSCVPDP